MSVDPDDHDYWRRWHWAEATSWQLMADLGLCSQGEADAAYEVYWVHCMMREA